MRGSTAGITLGVLGLMLIWRGITGDVMKTKLGEPLAPRWSYIVAGGVLLIFPAALFYLRV
jgi:hypothetical protein